MTNIAPLLKEHVLEFWRDRATPRIAHPVGAITESIPELQVMVFAPGKPGDAWVYVSIGAWQVATDGPRLEFAITSPREDDIHVETLAMVAHFHADPRYAVRLGKILSIGRPWMNSSSCDHLLVSLPYPFGPDFERCGSIETDVRFLWLLPITAAEADLAKSDGVEALEAKLEANAADTLDVNRPSVV